MKAITFLALSLLSFNALADQCLFVSQEEAKKAVEILTENPSVIKYCETCNDKKEDAESFIAQEVESVPVSPESKETMVLINGQRQDLAYIYVKTAENVNVNLATMIECSTLDKSSVPAAINDEISTILAPALK